METTRYLYRLEGLHCASCAAKIESALQKTPAVQSARIDLATARLTVETSAGGKDMEQTVRKAVRAAEPHVQVINLTPSVQADGEGHGHEHTHDHVHPSGGVTAALAVFCGAAALIALSFLPFADWMTGGRWVVFGLRAAAALLAGWRTMLAGLRSLFRLRMDENTLMTVAAAAAFAIGESFEGAMVLALFYLGEIFETAAAGRSRREIEKLAEIRPDTARLQIGDGAKVVPAGQVEPGSVILVQPFERIPLDGEIIEGHSNLDASALTGESLPVEAGPGKAVLSGMQNGEGLLKIRTTAGYEQSAASRIIALVEDAAGRKGKVEQFITRFARVYTPAVTLLALLLVAVPSILTGDFITWLTRGLTFLVASCPCALVISIPLSLFSGVGAASKRGVLIKGGRFEEILSKARAVVFDKTGTLTTGKLSVTDIRPAQGFTAEEVLRLAGLAEARSAHPAAKAVWEKAGRPEPGQGDYAEAPGHGVVYRPEQDRVILCGSARLMEKHRIDTCGMEDCSIYLAVDGRLAGGFSVADTVRPEAKEALDSLRELGVEQLVMLTGDSPAAAAPVAAACGLDGYYAGLLPEQKVERMLELKEQYSPILFVGDGINDAPVLAAADAGAAMGLGTDAAIEAADLVLSSNSLTGLADGVKVSRRAMGVARFNIVFALTVKAAVLVLAALGYAPMAAAVFADVGVSVLSVLNATRILKG
ncbi:MAG: cadmium-translocating P-type ATPase [Clostridiales bacterium]|nr:cadmium-translocating P-type ATPase [Clostridiales bacterium]